MIYSKITLETAEEQSIILHIFPPDFSDKRLRNYKFWRVYR